MADHKITDITRADIKDELVSMSKPPFHGELKLTDFLKRIWNLSQMPSTDSRFDDAEGDIWQHMVNNDDWTFEYLLDDYLGLTRGDDQTLLRFLEICIHPILRLDSQERDRRLKLFNDLLKPDGYELSPDSHISGRSVYKAKSLSGQEVKNETYEIVMSFAGEQRAYVRESAGYLRNAEVSVFYDEYEEVTLWGKPLAEHLAEVYGGTARYCVMFISKEYLDKVWTTTERRAALAKAMRERQEYILPYRFDDTVIPGLNHDIKYVQNRTARELADLILRKLGRPDINTVQTHQQSSSGIEIVKAEWGVEGDMQDVTAHLVRLMQAKTKDLRASITLFRDRHKGDHKLLIVEYRLGDWEVHTIVFQEGEPIFFPMV